MDDTILQQDVLDELTSEPGLDASRISVTADGGVVILTGQVGSYAEKVAAESAARRVKGVRAITTDLEVHVPYEQRRSDDEIAERALAVIRWSADLPAARIGIRVNQGWITLTGDVDWQQQRQQAESDVRKLAGVRGITNRIELRPRHRPVDLHDKIRRAFQRKANLASTGITIATDGGKVTLSGTVRSPLERTVAKQAVWSILGVTSVEDRLDAVDPT